MMDFTQRYITLRRRGASVDEALADLRRLGASPMRCIAAIRDVEKIGIVEAKEAFSTSSAWKALVDANDESLIEELEAAERLERNTTTIYVALLDEAVDVWRPVEAVHLEGDVYRIVSTNAEPDDELWEFNQGDVVRCVDRTLSGSMTKVAVSREEHAG